MGSGGSAYKKQVEANSWAKPVQGKPASYTADPTVRFEDTAQRAGVGENAGPRAPKRTGTGPPPGGLLKMIDFNDDEEDEETTGPKPQLDGYGASHTSIYTDAGKPASYTAEPTVHFEDTAQRAGVGENPGSRALKRTGTGPPPGGLLKLSDFNDDEEDEETTGPEPQLDGYGASHTSVYTDAVAKDSYDSLDDTLQGHLADPKLRELVAQLLRVCTRIAEALRVNLVTVNDSSNAFGDTQLTVDIIADQLLWEWAQSSELIAEASSEEKPEIVKTSPDGQFVLCWDPLDGSSIVDNNWAVGTIVGVWDKSTGLIGASGRDQVMSLVVLYGPRTTAFASLDDGVYEFTLGPGNAWICSRERIQIRPEAKIFAPANMRAAQEVEGYGKLIEYYMQNKYTLRYSGGLVPDVCQLFTKLQGIFTNPTSKASPAKLRLAFEAAPFARLVELAGGKTSDGVTGGSTLDIRISAVDQRCALALGSSVEVDRFNGTVLGLHV